MLVEFKELKVIAEKAAEKEVLVPEIVENDEYVDVCVGESAWRNADQGWIVEDDYRVAGEVWRVHKSDADPHPSKPHAHCAGGAKRLIGCKLRLVLPSFLNKVSRSAVFWRRAISIGCSY